MIDIILWPSTKWEPSISVFFIILFYMYMQKFYQKPPFTTLFFIANIENNVLYQKQFGSKSAFNRTYY